MTEPDRSGRSADPETGPEPAAAFCEGSSFSPASFGVTDRAAETVRGDGGFGGDRVAGVDGGG